ncbi:MAG TPA: phosphoenolpyruvate synthase [Gammaproteobacteria bacterium]|nr:phosphoenolpyruvate synthase [Gammaproteobacteria bacterium]
MPHYIRWFNEISIDDISTVGGKNASLGEMYQELTPQGIKVPNGFAITAEAYRDGLIQANNQHALKATLEGLNPDDMDDLARRGARARAIIYSTPLANTLQEQILAAYKQLQEEYGDNLSLAVRSSATAEDLPTASFAGQQETYLNIRDNEHLLEACRNCFASLFTDRAIHYRIHNGFDHFKVALSIGVMKMVRSDLDTSGVMFSLDTETGFRDVVFITAAYGLGETVVQGMVEPDEFYVHKPTFMAGHRAVLRRHLGNKQIKMIYAADGSQEKTCNVPVPEIGRQRYCLSDRDVLTLADYAIKVEKHYSEKAGETRPMDMEWARDGLDGELYMVQARPETVESQKQGNLLRQYHLRQQGEILARGYAVGTKIATGHARYIANAAQLHKFRPGEVLVAETTTPDWEPIMKIAAAIVTNRGGRTCHAAIIARELGVPAVVGCNNATQAIDEGTMVTVSCAGGNEGRIFHGELDYDVIETDLSDLPRPNTKIMVNLGNPDLAFSTSFLPCDGVGLARLEFIINEYIKAHPMALLHPERIAGRSTRDALEKLISGYADGSDYFVRRLAEGVGTIAAAFWPKPVVVRLSDFKSNEYASLLGGTDFEPQEDNPMLGFRGAARYTHPAYAEGFALECAAMKYVRDNMGLTNVKLMIPFCRRIEEGEKVLQSMAEHGLKRGDNGLEIYVMCEIPNNVILIDEFSKLFDGFSIGSNDLTQLTLGVDRDSEIVSFDFDERDPGVKQMIKLAVEGARRNHCHSGLCGQAPSDYPEMAEFLVEIGIDSMSLNPDTVLETTQHVLEVEKKLQKKLAP